MNNPCHPSLAGSSPAPFRVDPAVKTQLIDAEGNLIADFHPPLMRTEKQFEQSRANAALVERLMRAFMTTPDVP